MLWEPQFEFLKLFKMMLFLLEPQLFKFNNITKGFSVQSFEHVQR